MHRLYTSKVAGLPTVRTAAATAVALTATSLRTTTTVTTSDSGLVPPKSTDYAHYAARLNKGIGRSHHIFMDKAQGAYMVDVSGRKYLDFACGIGVTNLGHNHPRLVKVVQQQAGQLWHGMIAHGIHTALAGLIDEMETIAPPTLDNFFFTNSGAEAIEAALRCARSVTKRQNVMVVQGSFHGRTNACLALTTSKYGYGIHCKPTMPGVNAAPIPYTTQLKLDPTASVEEMTRRCLGIMEDLLFQVTHPSEVAMILVEPAIGEGGYLPLPAAYLKGLRALCDQHGILLCFDEVQSGYGRTGTMFAMEQTGVTPDILVFAKGVANGLPLSGFITRKAIGDLCPPGTQGGTYAANAVACASAAEVIRIFRDEKILDNVVERGQQLWKTLEAAIVANKLPFQEVRGRGLLIGLQFTDDVPAGTAGLCVDKALAKGLMILNTSKYETLRLIPPLNVTAAQIDEAVAMFVAATEDALKEKAYASGGSMKPIAGFRDCCADKSGCWSMKGWSLPCRRIAE